MAKYSVLITTSPDHQGNQTALTFCQALLEAGHTIAQVFFFGPGVLTANYLQSPASDEINLYQRWCDLHNSHKVPLWVCVTAATKRGIVDAIQAEELSLPQHTLTPPFEQVGLGEFFSRLHDTEHLVQF